MGSNDKAIVKEVQKTLGKIAARDPTWTLHLGAEQLTAEQAIVRLDKDKKLRTLVIVHYIGLAVEMEQKAREHVEGNSSSP